MSSCCYGNIRGKLLDLLQSYAVLIFPCQRIILHFYGSLTYFFSCFVGKLQYFVSRLTYFPIFLFSTSLWRVRSDILGTTGHKSESWGRPW